MSRRECAFDVGRYFQKPSVCAVGSGLIQTRVFSRLFALGFLRQRRRGQDAFHRSFKRDAFQPQINRFRHGGFNLAETGGKSSGRFWLYPLAVCRFDFRIKSAKSKPAVKPDASIASEQIAQAIFTKIDDLIKKLKISADAGNKEARDKLNFLRWDVFQDFKKDIDQKARAGQIGCNPVAMSAAARLISTPNGENRFIIARTAVTNSANGKSW